MAAGREQKVQGGEQFLKFIFSSKKAHYVSLFAKLYYLLSLGPPNI